MPMVSAEEKLLPMEKHGLKVMSMGLLLEPDQAVVWRGPMVHSVVKQFLGDVDWGELDYLIVDLPPGTGDAPLSADPGAAADRGGGGHHAAGGGGRAWRRRR